jgi:hypothetical protein
MIIVLYKGVVMDEKLAFALAALMFATIGLSAAEIPSLVGNWTGSYEGYTNGGGYKATNETGAITLVSRQ